MKDKPTGHITFLFTDIEGSTRLAQEFPETLPSALERHHNIMHKVIESNNGFVFEIIGDAFCCAFEKSEDAIKAAVQAQINLANEKWDDVKIKIRIGIHSGNVEWNGEGYIGYITLARTARVMSSAYGEQIIISNDAYELCIHKLGFGNESSMISFRNLGERRLKDLRQPIRLYQVLFQGLREDFPPLKTLDARPNNLPVQLTNFIGREKEMKAIGDLLKQTHILTLTGTGGSGKTRLALQIAANMIDDFEHGVWLIELASLSDISLLPQTITKAFGIQEQPMQKVEDTLIDFLKKKEMLIIFDNCEHLIDAAAHLTEKMLSNIPKLKIIATSREALRCSGEQTHNVSTLETPEPRNELSLDNLLQYESIRLFVERASSVNEAFKLTDENVRTLSQICFQLDGIPLAIELAAARIKAVSIEQIFERLNDRFTLLTGGKRTSLPRQKTLRAAIDWSYDLLSEEERILWGRLSVFSGGWTLDAAEVICSNEKLHKNEILDLLTDLTEKSIVIFDTINSRYRLLETIRQYGHEKLTERNEFELISEKHLSYFSELAQTEDAKLKGHNIAESLKVLDKESTNISKALDWPGENSLNIEKAKLASVMGYYWIIRGQISEGLSRLESVLQCTTKTQADFYYKLVSAAGILYRFKCEYKKAIESFEESLNYFRNGEKCLVISDLLNNLGMISSDQGNYSKALELHEEALLVAREIDDKRGIANSLNNLGNIHHFRHNYIKALELHEESLSLRRDTGDKKVIASSLLNLGTITREMGDYQKASTLYEESLATFREIGDKKGIAASLNYLGIVSRAQGDFLKAATLLESGLAISREIDDKDCLSLSLNNLGSMTLSRGNYVKAFELYEENLGNRRELKDKRGIAFCLNYLGALKIHKGEYLMALDQLEESIAISREIDYKQCLAESLNNLAKVFFEKGEFAKAKIAVDESLSVSRDTGRKQETAVSLYISGRILFKEKKIEEARKDFIESLTLGNLMGSKLECVYNILILTKIQIMLKDFAAAKIVGFIENYFKTNNLKLPESEQRIFDELMSELKEKFTDEERLKYIGEGKALTFDQIVENALKSESFSVK